MVSRKKEPPHNGNRKQYPRRGCKKHPLATDPMCCVKVEVIPVTRAAGAQVIEPLL